MDEESDLSVGEQIKAALKANAGRVIDLFREWDADGAPCAIYRTCAHAVANSRAAASLVGR